MPPEPKVSGKMWILLIISAVIVDAVQIVIGILLPVAGEIINTVANFFIGAAYLVYFKRKGVSMVRGKRAVGFILSFIADEMTLGFFPGWTFDMVLTRKSVKAEENPDKLSSKLFKTAEKGIDRMNKVSDIVPSVPGSFSGPLNRGGVRPPTPRIPLNSNGVRLPNNRNLDNFIESQRNPLSRN